MFMKPLTSLVAAGALLAATAPAQADCFGCNIVDDRSIHRLAPGHVVYTHSNMHGSDPVQIVRIDHTNRRVLVRQQNGQRQWYLASSLYTGNRINQRNGATVVGTLALLALLAGAAGSGSGSGASGGDSGYTNWLATRPSESESGGSSNSRRSNSDGCYWGNRDDGTCN